MPTRWNPDQPDECVKAAEKNEAMFGTDTTKGFLYRFMDRTVSCNDGYSIGLEVELFALAIRTETPAGWTIRASNARGWRFIGRNAHRKYAWPDLATAKASFLVRKKRQAAIYDARADRARKAARKLEYKSILGDFS